MATAPAAEFEDLIEYVKSSRGFDFTGYKRPSLERRFARRMQTLRIESYADYRRHLEGNPDEFVDLFNTILINVTAFFRDRGAWDYLRENVIPRIVANGSSRDGIRVWSTGCASGEEAYSLAICFAEAMPHRAFRDSVKIYATDVDEEALTEGRHALYSTSQVDNVPADLRVRCFDRVEQRHVVKPELRRAVIFGRHDVVRDPPISRIDLLASRNTLMYFTSDAQKRVLENFHFALRDGGVLFLGKSEMMLSRSGLFAPVDLRRRIFQKVPRPDALPQAQSRPAERREEREADAVMREVGFESAPIAQLIVDRTGTLTLANMQARTLFDLAPDDVGRRFSDLELSYRPVELRSQIDRAFTERHVISLRDVKWVLHGGDQRALNVQIAPLVARDGEFVGVGISFVDVTRYTRLQNAVELSKHDVERAYEEVQSTLEEYETTNEELQSTNEELETTNEELQSANEELQSTNEELETINDELNQRTDELNLLNIFLESILANLDSAVVVLDRELRVTQWSPVAEELWGVRRDEAEGRHFMNLDMGLPVEELRGPMRAALAGNPQDPVVVAGTNRRGQSVRCRVRLTPLVGDGDAAHGVIMLVEAADA